MTNTHRILLTGSQGFIGKNLAEFIKKFTNFALLCPTESDVNLTNSDAVQKCIYDFAPTIIIHSATGNVTGKSYADNVCEQNLRMYFNILRYRPSGCVLYSLCSGSSYNRDSWIENMNEDYFGQNIPTDSQGFSKYAIASHAMTQDDIVILRIFGIFGKYEDYRYKFISNTIAKRLVGMDVLLFKDAQYDYLDVLDFCAILQQMIALNTRSGVYNVTPDDSTTLSQIISIIDEEMNTGKKFSIASEGWGKPYTGSNIRLKKLLPEFKFTSLKSSISSLYDFYKSNIRLIDQQALAQDHLLQYAKSINAS